MFFFPAGHEVENRHADQDKPAERGDVFVQNAGQRRSERVRDEAHKKYGEGDAQDDGQFSACVQPSENPHTKESMLTASAVEKRKSKSIVLSRNVLESGGGAAPPSQYLMQNTFAVKTRIEA